MAENVQETRPPEPPPEPPPKPPELPKPTERSNRLDAKEHIQPNESQQSAQLDARNAAQTEHAKATNGREPEGLRPTPEFQARLDEHSAAKNGPEGLQPTPEFQERLDTHTAAKVEPNASAPQDSIAGERPQETTAGDRSAAAPAGEQAEEHAAARRAAAAEQAKATGVTATPGEAPGPQSTRDANHPALDNEQPHLDPASDLRTGDSGADTEGFDNPPKADPTPTETAMDAADLARVGDGSGPWFDEGTNHREGGAVQQMTEGSCVSASGEMLTDGRITQPELLSELGDWSNLSALRDELNDRDGGGTWTGHYFADGSEALRRASEGPMAAQVQAPLGRAHMVMLEPGENGSFTVRDPYEGSSYDVDGSWVEKYVAGGVFR